MPSLRFTINQPRVIHEVFENEIVIINLETGSYYSLDHVGAHVWKCLDRGLLPERLVEEIASSYEGDPTIIGHSIAEFLNELEKESLISKDGSDPENEVSPAPPIETEGKLGPFLPPTLNKYTDMEELLLLDPIHEVDEMGWPSIKQKTLS